MLKPLLSAVCVVTASGVAAAQQQPAPAPAPSTPPAATVSFFKEVRPILQKRCTGCHQPANRGGKLSVVTHAQLKSGGMMGPSFIPGKPADSPLYKLIGGKSPTMPKGGKPLPAAEVEKIRLWIVQGARDDTPQPKDPISQEHPPVYTKPPVVSTMAYSPDGQLLAVGGYREVLLNKADGSGVVGRLVGKSQRVESVAFSPDGKLLAVVGGNSSLNGEVQLWDVATQKQLKSVELGYDVLYGVSFSPDGKLLACGGSEKSGFLFTVPDLQQLLKFDNHSDWVFGTTFSRDSQYMVTVSRDKAIKLVEIKTKNFFDDINYQVYNGGYFSITRNPTADEVAVGGEEGIIRHYSIFKKAARNINRDDFNLLRTYEKLSGPIYTVAFSPDGTLLAAGGLSPEVRVFKTADGSTLLKLQKHSGSIHSLVWNPKGGQLAVSGFDGVVRIYAVPSGELVKEFTPVPLQAGRKTAQAR